MDRIFFPLSLFLSASLLFIIQPMVAKVLLPIYGGTPAVWTVCMLFFQILLLIGYTYAWLLSQLKGSRWRLVHATVCLLSLLVLPLAFAPRLFSDIPELQILENLALQLGLPLLVVGASAPLLQYAFSQTTNKQSADPYFLYVASNMGSLLTLIAYPWLIERFSGIKQQFFSWNIIYIIYLGFLFYLLFAVRYQSNMQPVVKSIKITWQHCLRWAFLSFIPCSLMLGVTFYISTDIAATPFFWVLPLALYLLSFVITFARKPLIPHAWIVRNLLIFILFPLLGFIIGGNEVQVLQLISANLIGFFVLALLCHGELVRIRPPANQLTTFYFCLSLGGVVAGLFNGLIAPRFFSHAYEYPLVFILSLLTIPSHVFKPTKKPWLIPALVLSLLVVNYLLLKDAQGDWLQKNHVAEIFAFALIMVWPGSRRSFMTSMVILFLFALMPWFKPTDILSQQRNFYGVKQVSSQFGAHVLLSQNTVHGFQIQDKGNPSGGAQSYYGVTSPVIQKLQESHTPLHALVLGLGTGSMACQFRKQDKLTLVEIDEQVIAIARNTSLFTYLRDCPPEGSIIQGDGLLVTTEVADGSQDVLVMDAFNSDAIPVHLLTLEAFTMYKKKITPDGIILVNMSNRHLHILPVLTGAGRELDMIVLYKAQSANNQLGQLEAEWALLTTNENLAAHLLGTDGWRFAAADKTQLWTNDYSNLMPLLKW